MQAKKLDSGVEELKLMTLDNTKKIAHDKWITFCIPFRMKRQKNEENPRKRKEKKIVVRFFFPAACKIAPSVG